jgi:hypothetical protein
LCRPNARPAGFVVSRGPGTQPDTGNGFVRCRQASGPGGGVVRSRRAGATSTRSLARREFGLARSPKEWPPPDLRRCSDSDESQTPSPGSQSFKSRIYRGRQGVQAFFSGQTQKFVTPDTWVNRRGPAGWIDEPHVVRCAGLTVGVRVPEQAVATTLWIARGCVSCRQGCHFHVQGCQVKCNG